MAVLEALARVQDVKDFRLGRLMEDLDLDPRQPVLWYRLLIREAREVMAALQEADRLRTQVAGLQAKAEKVEQEKATLHKQAAAASLAWQAELSSVRADKARLEEENRRLAETVYPAQRRYEGLKEFLRGDKSVETLSRLKDLVREVYLDALNEKRLATEMELYARQAGVHIQRTRPGQRRSEFDRMFLRAVLWDELLAAVEHPPDEVAESRRALEELLVFREIPCCKCGKPMTGWRRQQVLQAFCTWHHVQCPTP